MSEPRGHLDAPRPLPWTALAVAAGTGLLGTLVAMAFVAPVVVLGGLAWLGLVGLVGYRAARRTWDAGSTVPSWPDAASVEAVAEASRVAARQRYATTLGVVASGLLGPGFRRG